MRSSVLEGEAWGGRWGVLRGGCVNLPRTKESVRDPSPAAEHWRGTEQTEGGLGHTEQMTAREGRCSRAQGCHPNNGGATRESHGTHLHRNPGWICRLAFASYVPLPSPEGAGDRPDSIFLGLRPVCPGRRAPAWSDGGGGGMLGHGRLSHPQRGSSITHGSRWPCL